MAHLMDSLGVDFTLSEGLFSQNVIVKKKIANFLRVGGNVVKSLMKQLLEAVEYVHRHDIIHR